MRIPFTNIEIGITKRGANAVDSKVGIPLSFNKWLGNFTHSGRTPILENIYDTIAAEFSKIELFLAQDVYNDSKDGKKEHIYKKLTDHPNYPVLALRPNMFQTKSELLYTIAYQLHMYRNALVRIMRADGGVVLSLEPLNCEDYYFGQGYDAGGTLYLKLKEKSTGRVILLDYADVIHLRLNPNDIFYGDENNRFDLAHFVKLFDENLGVLLNELKNAGTVDGVIEIGASLGGGFDATLMKQEAKINKQKEISERIRAMKDGVIVLDSGEKWHSLTRTFRTMPADEVNNLMKYLYNFKGINQSVIDGTATEPQMQVFFNKTIMPLINRLLEELNYKFLTQAAKTQGYKVEYFKNPFEYMPMADMLRYAYLGSHIYTQNEIRYMALRLPPLPGGDLLMDNKNFTKSLSVSTSIGGSENLGTEN
jgi:hypothetical protein